jgi:hypothetical protein
VLWENNQHGRNGCRLARHTNGRIAISTIFSLTDLLTMSSLFWVLQALLLRKWYLDTFFEIR